jgi:type II secretory pathway component PulK
VEHGACSCGEEGGSTFIIVLWVAFGLVSMALYFAHSMSFELRASDNRVSGLSAEQAIQGAARYVNYLLATQIANGSNGFLPDPAGYQNQAVSVGDAHFWLIGRDTNTPSGPGQISFGLVDEGSKLNLNSATSNMLAAVILSLPRANQDLTAAILDWRDTNATGAYQTYYATRPQPYQCKSAPFETVDELRLIYGADMDTLVGEDVNRNGVLDVNEGDQNHNNILEAGILEYATVYSREPNTYSNGVARVSLQNVGTTGPLPDLLQTVLGSSRAQAVLVNLGLVSNQGPGGAAGGGRGGGGRGGAGGRPAPPPAVTFTSPLQLYRRSKMTPEEFAMIANAITTTTVSNSYIDGRINVNTASAAVLASLPGFDSNPELAQTLVSYRQSNPDRLGSVAWLVDAVGENNATVLGTLETTDCITTQSYQVSADVAALGPNGRGYRRIRFVFDTSDGTPKIVYRQDLTHLGWALGKEVRETWLLAKTTQ